MEATGIGGRCGRIATTEVDFRGFWYELRPVPLSRRDPSGTGVEQQPGRKLDATRGSWSKKLDTRGEPTRGGAENRGHPSVVESCRRLKFPVRDYLRAVLRHRGHAEALSAMASFSGTVESVVKSHIVKTTFVFVGFMLLAAAVAQQHDEPRPNWVIYGIALGQDGQPTKGIGLTASPLGVGLAAVLPHVRTNDAGEYRFANIPWWGKYTVYAEDEDAGYSIFSTGAGRSEPSEVELTPEHREAELKVYLPPRAGFVQIHLTNRRTGGGISGCGWH